MNIFKKIWPILTILVAVLIFFYPVFLEGKIPLPADFIVGTYYPWLDYKWAGYNSGVPVKNPITTDVVSFIYPMQMYAIDLLKKGITPLWNPLILTGTPLLANFQSAPFSPTNFLYFLFPNLTAWTIQIILQPLLAAAFVFLLLRSFGLSTLPAIAGGLFYAFAGFMTIWMEWNGHALVAAFTPLILFLCLKWFETKRILFGIFLSVALTLQIFSGYPQIILYQFLAIGMLTFLIKGYRQVPGLMLFVLLGIGLAATQIIPAVELLLHSQRSLEEVINVSAFLPWQYLVTFIAPDFFGNHATYNFWGEGDYTLVTGYSGVVVIILAVLGAMQEYPKLGVKFGIGLLILSFLVALPNPITIFFKETSLLGLQAASAHRVLFLSNLGFAILAGFGLNSLERKIDYVKVIRSLYLPFVLLFSFGIGTLICWTLLSSQPEVIQSNLTSDFSKLSTGLRNLVLPTLIFAITSIILLVLPLRFKKFNQIAALILILLALAELFRFGWKFTPFSLPDFVYPETPILSFLKSDPDTFRIAAENVIPINILMPYKITTLEGYDAMYPLKFAKYLSVLNSGNLDATPMGRYGSVNSASSPLFDLSNTKYILTLKKDQYGNPSEVGELPLKFQKDHLKEIFQDKHVAILENTRVLDRAFMVYQWDILPEEETLAQLIDPAFPLNHKIILTKAPNLISSIGKGKVEILSKEGNSFKVKTDQPGLLFISNAWYPGFEAFVDGQKEEILKADYNFMAVAIKDPGEHQVTIIYDPDSFKIGKMISLISLLGLVGLSIWAKYENTARNS